MTLTAALDWLSRSFVADVSPVELAWVVLVGVAGFWQVGALREAYRDLEAADVGGDHLIEIAARNSLDDERFRAWQLLGLLVVGVLACFSEEPAGEGSYTGLGAATGLLFIAYAASLGIRGWRARRARHLLLTAIARERSWDGRDRREGGKP